MFYIVLLNENGFIQLALAHRSLLFFEMLNQHSFMALRRALVHNETFMLIFIVYLFLNIDMTVTGIQKTANKTTKALK